MTELAKDKLEIIKDFEPLSPDMVRRKIDALAWHGKCLKIITPHAAQEAVVHFKK